MFAERAADQDDPNGYTFPHTAIAYLMGPDGSYVDHFPDAVAEHRVLERLRSALAAAD